METASDLDYKRSPLPQSGKEWKKAKDDRKAQKRKWKEDKLIKKLENEKRQKAEEEKREQEKEEEKKQELQHNGCPYTISIALPGSILDNAQTTELRTYLAGQIARAAVIFNVNEIIIFDDCGGTSKTTEGDYTGVGKKGHANVQMARILQYLECPQYLRKVFFPQHRDLQMAGLLNPLDCPHHMLADAETPYREGIVLDKPIKDGKGSFVNVGLMREIQIDKKLQHGVRVTVKLQPGYLQKIDMKKKVFGQVVSPSVPYTESSVYWGYTVRLASSLSAVFTESPYPEGYDLMIGTSERGDSVDDFTPDRFKHLVVVFGGVKGLEYSLDADRDLHMEDPSLLFQHYLNTCPQQGSGTIRTEEAILVSLSALRPKILAAQQKPISK